MRLTALRKAARTVAVPADPGRAPMVFHPITSLSVGIGEDAQVILSAAWRQTSRGTFISNSPNNPCLTAPRGSTRWAAVFGSTENTIKRDDGKRHRVNPPFVNVRAFTSFLSPGAYTNTRPTYSEAGGLFVHELPAGTSCVVEWKVATPSDATGGDTSIESQKISGDAGVTANRGMYLELIGFMIDEGASFDLVTIPPFRLLELRHGDSNSCAGYVHPTTDGPSYTLTQHRSGVVGQGVSAQSYDPRGAALQYPSIIMDEYCSTRGFNRDTIEISHGAKWQGIMGPLTRQHIVDYIWKNPTDNVYDSLAKPFPTATAFNDPAHWSGGGSNPLVGWYGSVENDAFQRVIEILQTFGVGDEGRFGGATFQAAIKATLDLWTSTFPDCRIIAHTGSLNDATFAAITPTLDTFARFTAACTGGGGTGRGFSTPSTTGAEDAIGYLFRVSDYENVTGISSSITAELHYDEAECIAIRDAVKTALFAWLDRALKVTFVDGVNGLDGNAGTYAAPKKTIGAAGSAWNFLSVAAGTYNEKITYGASGTATIPKTIFARGGTVVIDGGGVRDGVDFGSRSHVLLQNVEITNAVVGVKSTGGTDQRMKHVVVHGCTSHGFSLAGASTGMVDFCEAYANVGRGIDVAGTCSFTGRRNNWHGNDYGVKGSGTATFIDDGSHIHENTNHQSWTAGATVTYRHCKLAIGAYPTDQLFACSFTESGNTSLENCFLYNGNVDPLIAAYCIRCIGGGRVAFRNCIMTHAVNDFDVYVWVDATGPSGNIVESKNNVYLDEGQTLRFSYGATLGEGYANARAFTDWQLLTDTSSRLLDRGSKNGAVDLSTTAATAIEDDVPGVASIAVGAGADLSASYTKDFYKRPWGATWDAGPRKLS